jgi:NTE family protein
MFGSKKKISLVLGGGGTKGFIHIGVLRYLEEHRYTITDVAGTSIGALIGALVAMGRTSDEIYTKIQTLSTKDIIDIDRQYITIGGTSIISQLEDMMGDTQIEDLPRPFTAIATDLDSGEEIALTS